jgi:D-alanine-D-alanine ligase
MIERCLLTLERSKNQEMSNIALVYGGFSQELQISEKSAAGVEKSLTELGHKVTKVRIDQNGWFAEVGNEKYPIDKNDFSFILNGEKKYFESVYNIIHGTPGENGKLSAYFDLIGINHNTSSVVASAITFNKSWCNRLLSTFGIRVPKSEVFYKSEDHSNKIKATSYPCFVKPNNGGSSIGTHKVKNETELLTSLTDAFEHDNEVIVEEFIAGREFTNGIIRKGDELISMPITEVLSNAEFFDFEQKYSNQGANEITPAELSEAQTKNCQAITKKVFEILRLKKVARIDYILKDDEFVLIEVNTIPGMSPRSILPQQAKHIGYDYTQLVEILNC